MAAINLWGSYFGMFRDKFGIEWMVDFDPKVKKQHKSKTQKLSRGR